MIKIRNKRAILELLREGVHFTKIAIVTHLEKDSLTNKILLEAQKLGIEVETLPIWKMSESRSGEAREVIIGYLAQQKTWTLQRLLTDLEKKQQKPFFLLLNKVHLSNNIGAIARTAFATGVNGLIFEGAKDDFYNEDTVHYSIGAIARIPHIKMNIYDALKELSAQNIATYALDMQGTTYFKEDLTGSAAFVLGAEREGVLDDISGRCHKKLAIPMQKGIDSLNVGVSASVILYEKVRQEST